MSLRIAHVVSTFPPYLGGAGTVCFELARGLAERGHRVEVFTSTADGETPPTPAVVHRLPPRFAIGNAPLLPPLARLGSYDVVHLHYPFIFGAELLLLGSARRSPLVVSYHNRLVGQGAVRSTLFRAYEETWGRATAARAACVCVLSEAHAATVPYLARARRSAVVPNGVDVDVFAPGPSNVRARLGIPDDAPLIAFVATLDRAHYLKRPDLAIDALARLGDLGAHLLIVGDGEDAPALRERVRAAGLGRRVHFAGAAGHDALPTYLRAADLLVSSSELESFGLVLIEAMATGLPVVSTDLPGTRAVVRDGETGFLVPRADADAIALGIRRALASDRAAVGAASRADCERRFAWPRVVDAVEAVYARVAAKGASLP